MKQTINTILFLAFFVVVFCIDTIIDLMLTPKFDLLIRLLF